MVGECSMKIFKRIIFILLFIVLVAICFFWYLYNGNLKVKIDGTTCLTKKIGISVVDDYKSDVYSYCFKDISLKKVLLKDGNISFSKLTPFFIQTLNGDCFWDGGTCLYKYRKYQVLKCQHLTSRGDIVIAPNSIDSDFLYKKFCNQ